MRSSRQRWRDGLLARVISDPRLRHWPARSGRRAIWEYARNPSNVILTDGPKWNVARGESAVIITKDEDFVDRWLLSDQPVPLVWIRKGNCSNRALLAWLEPLWHGWIKAKDSSSCGARVGQSGVIAFLGRHWETAPTARATAPAFAEVMS